MIFNLFFIILLIVFAITTWPTLLLPMEVRIKCAVFCVNIILFALKILSNIKLEVKGLENLPKEGPYIVASEHQSTLETLVFLTLFKNPVYVVKKELFRVPLIGHYIFALKMIPVDRGAGIKSVKQILKLAKKRVEEGRTLIIFPQGHRVPAGQDVDYQPGVAAIYKNLSLPVIPVALNTGLFWPRGIVSLGKKSGTATFQILPPIQPGMEKNDFLVELKNKIQAASKQLA